MAGIGGQRDRYGEPTEYGGRSGRIQRGPNGEDLPLPSIPGATGRSAGVVRSAGIRGDFSGTVRGDKDSKDGLYAPDRKTADELDAATNGYGKNAPQYGEQLQ